MYKLIYVCRYKDVCNFPLNALQSKTIKHLKNAERFVSNNRVLYQPLPLSPVPKTTMSAQQCRKRVGTINYCVLSVLHHINGNIYAYSMHLSLSNATTKVRCYCCNVKVCKVNNRKMPTLGLRMC